MKETTLKTIDGKAITADDINAEIIKLASKFGDYFHDKLEYLSENKIHDDEFISNEGKLLFEILGRIGMSYDTERKIQLDRERMEIESNTKILGRFREKSDVVDAAKNIDSDSGRAQVQMYFGDDVYFREDGVCIVQDVMECPVGDWIIKKPNGEYTVTTESRVRGYFYAVF